MPALPVNATVGIDQPIAGGGVGAWRHKQIEADHDKMASLSFVI